MEIFIVPLLLVITVFLYYTNNFLESIAKDLAYLKASEQRKNQEKK